MGAQRRSPGRRVAEPGGTGYEHHYYARTARGGSNRGAAGGRPGPGAPPRVYTRIFKRSGFRISRARPGAADAAGRPGRGATTRSNQK